MKAKRSSEPVQRFGRRDLLQVGAALAANFGLGRRYARVMAAGLDRLLSERPPVLWLQGLSCSGCSVSFLNTHEPGPLEVLTEIISLVYHSTVSATQGRQANEVIDRTIQAGDYLLVMEGAIPTMPEACRIGGRPLTGLLPEAVRRARAVIAVGTCASFGGIPAAEGNPTSAMGMKAFMESARLPTGQRLVNCPGCPVHPASFVGTLATVLARGYPKVDPVLLTPAAFYGHSVHDECPKFHYWEKHEFAGKFGDEGCLFKLGCLGPLSHTDCPRRQWNGGVNWCIRAGAPCVACTSPDFARRRDFPFYRKGEEVHAVAYKEEDRQGATQ